MHRQEYPSVSDERLIERYRGGESAVADFLLNKYKGMVRGKAASLYILGGDTEDLIQEGMIGLFQAIRDFDAGRDTAFSTFAELCVVRRMYSAVEAASRRKHLMLNHYVSLYERVSSDDGTEEKTLAETLAAGVQRSPEEEIIEREEQEKLRETIDTVLSDFERRVTDLWMTGRKGEEIARILGRSVKSTDNALTRAKAKLKKHLGTRG